MPHGLLAALLVLHGLITAAIGAAPAGDRAPTIANPSWLAWWPTTLGRSWLVDAVHLGGAGYAAGGALWVASGLAFLGAGLGLFGVPVLRAFWQPLGVAGGGVGLLAVSLYFHPWYALALAINVAVVLSGAGASRLPAALTAG